MSIGPIKIQTFFPKSLLDDTQTELLSLSSSNEFPLESIESNCSTSMTNSNFPMAYTKRKRGYPEEYKISNEHNSIAPSVDSINLIKRNKITMKDTVIESYGKSLNTQMNPIQQQILFNQNTEEINILKEFPFEVSQQVIYERTNLILDEIKNSSSFDDAHKKVNFQILDFLSLIETNVNKFIKNGSEEINDTISISKISEIIKERDYSSLKAQNLDALLKQEQSYNISKDNQIKELKSEIDKKDLLLNQINKWVESYLESQRNYIPKSCGFNERFPPDVY